MPCPLYWSVFHSPRCLAITIIPRVDGITVGALRKTPYLSHTKQMYGKGEIKKGRMFSHIESLLEFGTVGDPGHQVKVELQDLCVLADLGFRSYA